MSAALRLPPSLLGARLAGFGAARPRTVVTADELGAPFGRSAEWLATRTGITQLRRLADGETLAELAGTAGEAALADADLGPGDVDAVIVATCSVPAPEQAALADEVRTRLAPRAVGLALNSACSGFCYALGHARSLVATGAARTVAVIGAEQMSRILDPSDLGTSILFGDAAGAVVVTADDGADPVDGIAPTAWSSDGAAADVLTMPPGSGRLQMDGRQVFRWAVEQVHHVAEAACRLAGVSPADIDVFVPHQANLRIVDAITRRLRMPRAVVATDVTVSGNTSAASIPLALTALREAGRLRPRQRALFVGYGAGLGIAGQVVRLP